MRCRYRDRRDALVEALHQSLPEAAICGIAAGLHGTVCLPEGSDELAIREGRSFIFRCREDVQTVLAHELHLETRVP